jgi:hypothetical protein
MTSSPTPETDAAILESHGHWSFALRAKMEKLELERNAARAEVEAMREAIREAHDTFVNLSEYWNKDQNEKAMADACWHTVETSLDALAKLQPFLPDATPPKP